MSREEEKKEDYTGEMVKLKWNIFQKNPRKHFSLIGFILEEPRENKNIAKEERKENEKEIFEIKWLNLAVDKVISNKVLKRAISFVSRKE